MKTALNHMIKYCENMLSDKAKEVLVSMKKDFNIEDDEKELGKVMSVLILHIDGLSKEALLKENSSLVEPYQISDIEKIAVDRLYS